MVASAPQSQSQTQTQPPSAEEEALKRNTDCVYFLASPLTCKKGSECDYRHSDIARLNPRDCYYWLHGNCLNPKCAFRHPPLDGLLGTQAPTSAGPSAPVSQNVPMATPHVPNAPTKPGVPCVFFQKGNCLKGDWCPFVHTPNSLNNKPSPVPAIAPASEPANFKKAATGLEKSVQEKKILPKNAVAQPFKDSKPTVKVDPTPPRNDFSTNRRVPQTSAVTEYPGYRSAPPPHSHSHSHSHPVSNGNWSSRVQQPNLLEEPESMNSKDAEEASREPSPGFDVLVDDDGRDSDFYPGEDRYGHETRNDYDIDYNAVASIDDERYRDPIGYETHDHRKGQYGWEQQRGASSERMSYIERRSYPRPDSRGQVDELDLRHRLSKNKKPNGLRSVISHEHGSYHGGSRRDDHHQHVSLHENSISSRLRGRIRMPGRSSSPNERDMIGSRVSPIRASISSGRIRERIKGRVGEAAFNNGGSSNHRGVLPSRRDVFNENNSDFAAPKSLAELKSRKTGESSRRFVTEQQSLGKRKHLMSEGNQQNENDLSFEGPKPLKEILKRKKGEVTGNTSVVNNSSNEGHISQVEEEEAGKKATENDTVAPSKETEVEESKVEAEDGMAMEDGEYEHKDGESDYEQVGGEEYELYDGENGDAEGEYLEEEEDEDDFAKKMGVMYS